MATPTRSIVDRMKGAALLHVPTYEEVEADTTATGQAATVVVIVAICSAIGALGRGGISTVLTTLVMSIVGWLIWSGITYLIGDKVLGGTATWGELLRTLGFAQSPGVLMILGIVPVLGWLVLAVVWLWMLVAGVIAVRQALDFSTGKAVLTVLLGWVAQMILFAIFGGFATVGTGMWPR